MIRRDVLRCMALALPALGFPGITHAAAADLPRNDRVIFDGRFRQARIFAARALAAGAINALDCRMDAALLWYQHCAGQIDPACSITGITGATDAMILADCARRDGLVFTHSATPAEIDLPDGLIIWSIGHKAARGEPSRT